MSLVKGLAKLFVVLGLFYLLLILAVPATEFETRVEIDRPVAETWAVFMDASLAPAWMTGLAAIETLEGSPGTIGSRHRLVFDQDGQRIELEERVTRLVPEREIAFHISHDLLESDVSVRFDDLGGRTAITTTNTVVGSGLYKPLVPLAKDTMRERQLESYERLEALVESR